ncbi:L,D-transpeptidase family protein [Lacibacter sp. H407]|uniref:L,D-transpeptidase family protein n=1 Tax=Lacibacter sp. H407 TaxID=3133423 RepID=UPI0030BDC692
MKSQSTILIFCCVLMLSLSGFSLFHRGKTAVYKPVAKKSAYYKVVIDKSNYELKVYDEEGWLFTYPVVFGTSEKTDKMMEGDRRTPEGNYRIIAKKIHAEWGHFLLLDYPTQTDIEKFNARKSQGIIPPYAKPGGGIGIHATRRNEDRFVDYYYNWTLGCISTKREYAKELYDLLPVGTEVTILR